MEDGHCVRTVHAEANAIAQAARHGVRIDGADIYVTASPCWGCFRILANAGIAKICFGEFYRDPRIFDFSKRLGIELVDMSGAGQAIVAPAIGVAVDPLARTLPGVSRDGRSGP
jgi:dCMP deaminase